MEVGKKPLVLMLVFLFIIAGIAPSVNASVTGFHPFNVGQSDVDENSHPDYYNITIYRCNGFSCEKVVKTVSYDVAMEIKQRFNNIDASFDNSTEKISRKFSVLKEYNVLTGEDIGFSRASIDLDSIKPETKNGEEIHWYSFLRYTANGRNVTIFGTVKLNVNMGINLIFLAPFLLVVSRGGNLTFYTPIEHPTTNIFDKILLFLIFNFCGVILLVPFISPGGFINGKAMLLCGGGRIKEEIET